MGGRSYTKPITKMTQKEKDQRQKAMNSCEQFFDELDKVRVDQVRLVLEKLADSLSDVQANILLKRLRPDLPKKPRPRLSPRQARAQSRKQSASGNWTTQRPSWVRSRENSSAVMIEYTMCSLASASSTSSPVTKDRESVGSLHVKLSVLANMEVEFCDVCKHCGRVQKIV